MHIELIDLLRCPRDHEETWLVAALSAVEDRFVLKAKLGCPVCGATYLISNGVADLRVGIGHHPDNAGDPSPDDAMRIAALLSLTRPGAVILLEGSFAASAQQVSEIAECKMIALNPASPAADSESVATVLCDARLPFASGAVGGAACETEALIQDIPRVLSSGARALLAPNASIPAGMVEVARDDRNVLVQSTGPLISLRR